MRKANAILMIRSFIIVILTGILSFQAAAQRSSRDELRLREDSLKGLASVILNGREASDRFRADSTFTRMLVRALKTPHSFRYPFDSLRSISRLYAPDSSFRIITWQVVRDEQVYRRHGAIQMRTADGSLKLFPLIDRTQLIADQRDTVTGNDWWIGSIYYRIIQKSHEGRPYYTLLGYDEHTMRSTRKRAEVLSFDASGNPRFGGPFFSFRPDSTHRAVQTRFWIEYKKDGNARMQYDEELDLIIFDHLISETEEPKKLYTYIPDGDYEGFRWENGKWVHIEKVFNFKLKDGEAPVVAPVKGSKFGGGRP